MNSVDDHLISLETAANLTSEIVDQSLLESRDTSFVVYDYRKLEEKLNLVRNSFPSFWKHATAIKANPLAKIIKHIGQSGNGLEAASYEEVWLAQKAKAPFIIWDSPAKSEEEISLVFNQASNIIINANSLDELKALCDRDANDNIQLGLRINPEMSLSSMSSMTVGSTGSKFGEPISNAADIVNYFKKSGLNLGLHIHASSQNNNLKESVSAVKRICELALEIGLNRISYIDIGGGFPADYGFEKTIEISKYSALLREECPILFDESVDVYTEFGRYYHANAGFNVSRINEVKAFPNQQTLTNHLGADMFLRESYQPGKWKHRLGIMNKQFKLISEAVIKTDVGGPLCFGGDYLAKNVSLPPATNKDYLIIMDTGANSFALWSMHCSRTFPKVIGIDQNGTPFILKKRQELEDIEKFWS